MLACRDGHQVWRSSGRGSVGPCPGPRAARPSRDCPVGGVVVDGACSAGVVVAPVAGSAAWTGWSGGAAGRRGRALRAAPGHDRGRRGARQPVFLTFACSRRRSCSRRLPASLARASSLVPHCLGLGALGLRLVGHGQARVEGPAGRAQVTRGAGLVEQDAGRTCTRVTGIARAGQRSAAVMEARRS
jgi:hypothetical protein